MIYNVSETHRQFGSSTIYSKFNTEDSIDMRISTSKKNEMVISIIYAKFKRIC